LTSITVLGSTVISFSRASVSACALLVPAAQVLGQELLGRREACHVVDGAREAVALVGSDHVLDGEPAIAERDHDLVGLGLLDPRVVGPLQHQEGRLDWRRR
jgi:hypothetical protein